MAVNQEFCRDFGRVEGAIAYYELLEISSDLADRTIPYIANRAADHAMNKMTKEAKCGLIPEFVANSIAQTIRGQVFAQPSSAEAESYEIVDLG